MNLSKRLKTIADLVDTTSIIDVGCDHAYLDIYLSNLGISCLGVDISKNVIDNALKNLEKYNVNDKVKILLNDGLKDITLKDTDTVIISGMGTSTILNILSDLKGTNPLIISSNNDLELLRREIIKKGYKIDDEKVVYEKGHYYVIIKFIYGNKKYKKVDYKYGPVSKHDKAYMTYILNKNKKIYSSMPEKYIFKKIKLCLEIKKINKLLNKEHRI